MSSYGRYVEYSGVSSSGPVMGKQQPLSPEERLLGLAGDAYDGLYDDVHHGGGDPFSPLDYFRGEDGSIHRRRVAGVAATLVVGVGMMTIALGAGRGYVLDRYGSEHEQRGAVEGDGFADLPQPELPPAGS